MIVFCLGRIRAPQGPGMILLLPFIDHWQRVDLRTRAFNVPPGKLTTKDGAMISMGADIQFRVWDPVLSVMMVKDLNAATRMMAQNAMNTTLLKKNLREIQTEKLQFGDQLLLEINDMTKSWGLEVDQVELILEAVLQPSQESLSAPLTMTPPILGFEGLHNTIQQLATHFFSNSVAMAAAASPETVNKPMGQCTICHTPIPQASGIPDQHNLLFANLQAKLSTYQITVKGSDLVCDNCGQGGEFWCSDCEKCPCIKWFETHQRYLK
ncbi:Stomatin-like protein 1 [Chelonia mydas]|uniref:Stomatin-like protein 1 n=1 Tax=Chelonia mydas TaxID=8469 RepID=M7BJ36_CHEMY|nr:Stomatin-like protein 1 [Chelonia mydas]